MLALCKNPCAQIRDEQTTYAVFFAALFFAGAFVAEVFFATVFFVAVFAAVFFAGAAPRPLFSSAATRRSLIVVSWAIVFSRAAIVRELFI